jgi:ABC-2 type transport system permease protein
MSTAVPTGSIYDLGYRRYEGPRLGRRHAVRALYLFSLRSAFGIGRSGRAKIAPFGLALFALLPALISVGITAIANQAGAGAALESPINYATYLGYSETLLLLFCAAQGPELVGRDQRYAVLPLYFSRALRRTDYALAKLGALWTAIGLVFLVPQTLLFAGRVLAAQDVPAAFSANVGSVPPILAITALLAAVLGGISLALASSTPRRAYATAAIIAAFIVPPILATIVSELAGGSLAVIAALLDPVDLLDGANAALFGRGTGNEVIQSAGLGTAWCVAVLIAYAAVTALVTIRRYQRIAA